jgi:hypothetical protein
MCTEECFFNRTRPIKSEKQYDTLPYMSIACSKRNANILQHKYSTERLMEVHIMTCPLTVLYSFTHTGAIVIPEGAETKNTLVD